MTGTLTSLLAGALAPATQSAYRRSWQLFRSFLRSHGREDTLPVLADSLALFIAYLDRLGYAPATISSYVSAIGYVHKLNGWTDPTSSFVILKMLQSCHKKDRRVDSRPPITKSLLGKLLDALSHTEPNAYKRALFRAMFCLAFHAFLRIGEITVATVSHPNAHLIQVGQLEFSQGNMVLTFLSFKHSQGRPFALTISHGPVAIHCPVQLMSQYLQLRGSAPGPLFQICQQSPVTRGEFSMHLSQALSFCGIHKGSFQPHSFRIGAATEAAANGLSDAQIRQLGRWKSDAFKRYIRCAARVSKL